MSDSNATRTKVTLRREGGTIGGYYDPTPAGTFARGQCRDEPATAISVAKSTAYAAALSKTTLVRYAAGRFSDLASSLSIKP